MKISCDIIKDLLPLYAEGLTSQASNEMVDEHLVECDECTRQLGILKKAAQVPIEVNVTGLKRVGNAIRRRKVMSVMATILVIASLLVSVGVFLTVPVALPIEDTGIVFAETEDGGLACTVWEYAFMWNESYDGNGPGYDNRGYVLQTTRMRRLMTQFETYKTSRSVEYGTVLTEDGRYMPYISDESWLYQGEVVDRSIENNQWYLNIYDGTAETLMWDGGAEYPEDMVMMEPNNTLLWLLVDCTALAAVLTVLARFIKKPWAAELMQRFAVLAGSVAYADVVVCADRYVSLDKCYELSIRLQYISVLALVVAITGMFCLRLHRLNRQDKGL